MSLVEEIIQIEQVKGTINPSLSSITLTVIIAIIIGLIAFNIPAYSY